MAKSSLTMELVGWKELTHLLNELPKRVARKGLRQAISAAASPIVKAAKSNAAKLTGTLKKSIKKKIKTYSDGNVVAIIGADRSIVGQRITKGGKVKRVVPANYIHLVEKGHAGPHPASAKPFLRPAYENHKQQAVGIAEKKLKEVIENEAAKLGKK